MLDDWIPIDNLHFFEEACRKYGLFLSKESIFLENSSLEIKKSIGYHNLTTTKMFGAPISSKKKGMVHVFISKSKKILERGRGYGWYPLVINGRVMKKMHSDHYKYGYFLGYPKCCRNFFWKYNNHVKYLNTLFLPHKNTKKPSFLCNGLTKDSHSYIYHIPCSFDCKKTIASTSKLREFILEKDPAYAKIIDRTIKQIFLVFKERNVYGFEGEKINEQEITYNNAYFIDYALHSGRYLESFRMGNRLKVNEERIEIYRGNELLNIITKQRPETGFIISFKD